MRARKTRVDDCMYTIGLFMGKECDGHIAGASKFSYTRVPDVRIVGTDTNPS